MPPKRVAALRGRSARVWASAPEGAGSRAVGGGSSKQPDGCAPAAAAEGKGTPESICRW